MLEKWRERQEGPRTCWDNLVRVSEKPCCRGYKWTVTEENTRCFPLASTCTHTVHAYTTQKTEKVMYILIVSYLPHASLFPDIHIILPVWHFYLHIIGISFLRKYLKIMLGLLRVAKMLLRAPTQPSFFLFPNGLGESDGSVSCMRSVPRSHVFKNPGVVVFSYNPSAGEVKTRRLLVPITS